MPAGAERFGSVPPRERAVALGVAAIVQVALGLVLLGGLRVDFSRTRDAVERLIEIGVPPPPVIRLEPAKPKPRQKKAESAPRAFARQVGGSPGPAPAHAPPSIAPIVAIQPTVAPSGGGSGTGPATGSGSGGGAGGEGFGGGDGGGTELELISGDIVPRDYPRHLGNAGIGGRVTVTFTVQVNGRATGCRISRSSGIPELDALTCRLIERRFRFRPSTDRYGRPVPEEVDWDHDWIAG